MENELSRIISPGFNKAKFRFSDFSLIIHKAIENASKLDKKFSKDPFNEIRADVKNMVDSALKSK